jgi:hypothetical protein
MVGGEIDCLDAGDFKPVTIKSAVTIDCGPGGITVAGPAANGIVIAAGNQNDVVTIRNLSIRSFNHGGIIGIQVLSAAAVHIENVEISGFDLDVFGQPTPAGIDATVTNGLLLTVRNTTIQECVTGIRMSGPSLFAPARGDFGDVRIYGANTAAIDAHGNSLIGVHDSTLVGNNIGILQTAIGRNTSRVEIASSRLTHNSTALLSTQGGSMSAFGNFFSDNTTIFSLSGGQIFTGGDNAAGPSQGGLVASSLIPKI